MTDKEAAIFNLAKQAYRAGDSSPPNSDALAVADEMGVELGPDSSLWIFQFMRGNLRTEAA